MIHRSTIYSALKHIFGDQCLTRRLFRSQPLCWLHFRSYFSILHFYTCSSGKPRRSILSFATTRTLLYIHRFAHLVMKMIEIFLWKSADLVALKGLTYSFTIQQAGIAFSAAIFGSVLSTAMSTTIDLSVPHWCTKNHDGTVPEEYRMLPAMIGGLLVTTSLFWIGWTAKPSVHYLSPIFGTTLYIWGAMSIIVSLV